MKKLGNLFDEIPDRIADELFEPVGGQGGVLIERIVSQGQSSPQTGWYDQEQQEWVVVLQGAAILGFDDGSEIQLTAGDYIEIPAHTRHRVSWTDPGQKTVWLAVHYPA